MGGGCLLCCFVTSLLGFITGMLIVLLVFALGCAELSFNACPTPSLRSSSRRDEEETDADARDEVPREEEVSGETESAEETSGGDVRACAIDCAASEMRREARF